MANRGSASKRFSKLIRYFNFQQRTVVDPVTQQETIEEVPVLENVSLEASTDVTVSGKQVVTTANNSISAESLTIDTAEVTYNHSDSSLHVNGNALAFKSDVGDNAFPSGTKMFFQQSTAPVGWTKDTTHHDTALRLVNSTVSSGGSSDFSTVFGKTTTNSHTLTTSQIPAHSHTTTSAGSHNHTLYTSWYNYSPSGGMRNWSHTSRACPGVSTRFFSLSLSYINQTGSIASVGNHSHGGNNTGGGGSHSHNMDLRVKYVDIILAVKD